MKRLFSALILLLVSFSCFAQFNLYRNLNVKDGLPSSEVYEMLEESTGYFWFATDMGVSRYNGYTFTNYTTEDGLPDNTILGIYEDYKHNIWFRSFAGKLSYYQDNKINAIPANDELGKILNNYIVTSIYVDKKDTIWVGVSGQFILKIEPGWNKENVKKINLRNGSHYIYEIDKDGFIYGGRSINNLMVTVHKNGHALYTIDSEIANRFGVGRSYVSRMRDGNYLVSLNNVVMNFNEKKIISKQHEDELIICLKQDSDKSIIIGNYVGLKVINSENDDLIQSFGKFKQKTITALHRDKENELWICTKGHGVFYLPYPNFSYYTTENGLTESSISCFGVLGEKVVAGHLNGEISILDKNNIKTITLNNDSILTGISEVTSVLNVKGEKNYVGTISCIYEFFPKTNRIEKRLKTSSKKLLALKNNAVIGISSRALVKYSHLGFKDSVITLLPMYSDNIYEDNKGTMWICAINGLYTYNNTSGLSYVGSKDTLLSRSRIVDIAADKNNQIWMVSRGEGVLLKQGDHYFQIQQKDGLSSNMCRALFIDSANTIWVGTNNGLNKIKVTSYNPFTYTINTFYSKNGLLTNEVNNIIKFKNKIWLMHNNGISIFASNQIKDNVTPPPVYITKVLVNGQIPGTKDLQQLTYAENYITIHYNGLSYKELGNIEYKYKLEGLDNNWTNTYTTSVTFQTLPPGTYCFIIYAKNNDGYLSSAPAKFNFTIKPPWWQTWIFRLTIITALLLLVGIAFKYRLSIIKRRERLKSIQRTRMYIAELKALRSQMNPHFVFNAINSVQYFITNNDPKSSQKYLSKFAKLIRYVIDNSKPATIPLNMELEALDLYLDLESLRFENKFEYTIAISERIDVNYIRIPSMLIQPYVENAIWHGLMHKKGNGKIDIHIDLKENILTCSIEDNGIGRKKSQELKTLQNKKLHKSIGMSVASERLDIINQMNNSNLNISVIDLEDEHGVGIGTRVELNIPFY